MTQLNLKPAHASIKAYYQTLENFGRAKFDNEGNIRGAFEALLKKCARQFEWFLVPEYQLTRTGKHPLRTDAALLDAFNLPRAYWEAKDSKDDLRVEMEKKLALGYPRTNILFQSPPAPSSIRTHESNSMAICRRHPQIGQGWVPLGDEDADNGSIYKSGALCGLSMQGWFRIARKSWNTKLVARNSMVAAKRDRLRFSF